MTIRKRTATVTASIGQRIHSTDKIQYRRQINGRNSYFGNRKHVIWFVQRNVQFYVENCTKNNELTYSWEDQSGNCSTGTLVMVSPMVGWWVYTGNEKYMWHCGIPTRATCSGAKIYDMLPSTRNMHVREKDNRRNFSAGLHNIRRRWDQISSPTAMKEKWKNLTETAFQPDYHELIRRITAWLRAGHIYD